VLQLLPLAERRLVVALVVFSFASGVLPILFTLSVGLLVGNIPDVVHGGFDSPAGTRMVWTLVATTATFAALQVLAPAQGALELIVRRQIDEKLMGKTLDDLMRPHGIAHLEDPELLGHLTLIREGSEQLEASPGGAAVMTVRLLGVFIQGLGGAVLVGIFFSWWVAAGLLAACLVCRRIHRRALIQYLWSWVHPDELRIHRRYHYELTLGFGSWGTLMAKESRVFGLLDWLLDRFNVDWHVAMRRSEATRNRLFRAVALGYGVLLISYTASFILVAVAAAGGSLGLGALAVVLQASFDLSHLSRWQPWDRELEFGTVVLPKFWELEALTHRAALVTGRRGPSTGLPRREVRFEEVTFRYPGSDHDVLGRLDLSIPAGHSLAIVGPNGAGKTTLIKLLARLYEPTEGRISVDGIDAGDLDPDAWQRQISVIFQDFVRYPLPARENVGFGALSRLEDQPALEHAAAMYGADAVIGALPYGWDTVLSRRYSRGADISDGQWQRIALARCHLAIEAGARVLVLDEPTASLDVRGEAEFFGRFVELTEGLTTILISHRFSTVRAASRIVVLDEGGISEDGSHEELVGLGGIYADMFRKQAGRFAERKREPS
jgi:ABC-type multidrug transport system fused ATPase/permease subunit